MREAGKTPWFPRHINPVRNGAYECHIRIACGGRTLWMLEWDGVGFIVPIPMGVFHWRGQTKAAHRKSVAGVKQ